MFQYNFSRLLQNIRLCSMQNIQRGVKGSTKTFQYHDGYHDRSKLWLKLHLEGKK